MHISIIVDEILSFGGFISAIFLIWLIYPFWKRRRSKKERAGFFEKLIFLAILVGPWVYWNIDFEKIRSRIALNESLRAQATEWRKKDPFVRARIEIGQGRYKLRRFFHRHKREGQYFEGLECEEGIFFFSGPFSKDTRSAGQKELDAARKEYWRKYNIAKVLHPNSPYRAACSVSNMAKTEILPDFLDAFRMTLEEYEIRLAKASRPQICDAARYSLRNLLLEYIDEGYSLAESGERRIDSVFECALPAMGGNIRAPGNRETLIFLIENGLGSETDPATWQAFFEILQSPLPFLTMAFQHGLSAKILDRENYLAKAINKRWFNIELLEALLQHGVDLDIPHSRILLFALDKGFDLDGRRFLWTILRHNVELNSLNEADFTQAMCEISKERDNLALLLAFTGKWEQQTGKSSGLSDDDLKAALESGGDALCDKRSVEKPPVTPARP